MKPSRESATTCALCGRRPATTKDHIPPKGIFCQPRPSNLITVPACSICNNAASGLDERFRAYLGLHVSRDESLGSRFFTQEAIPTLRHNQRLLRQILVNSQPTCLTTEHGVIYERGIRTKWDSEAHDAIVERTIRGLYYHHFREILADRVSIKVHWFRSLTTDMIAISEGWSANVLGNGECVYKFGRADDSPLDSIWIFQFYSAHWAGGYTTPISI